MTYTPSFASQFEVTLAVDGCKAAKGYDPANSLVETSEGVRAIISSSNGLAAGHCHHVVQAVLSVLSNAGSLVPKSAGGGTGNAPSSTGELIGKTGAQLPGGLAIAASAVGLVVFGAIGYIFVSLGRAKSAAEAEHERYLSMESVSGTGNDANGRVTLGFGAPGSSDGEYGGAGSHSEFDDDDDSGCDEDIVVFVEHGNEEIFSDDLEDGVDDDNDDDDEGGERFLGE